MESADNTVSAQRVEANDKDLLLSTTQKEESRGAINNGSAYNAPAYDPSAAASQTQLDLVSPDFRSPANSPSTSLAIDDLLGLSLTLEPTPDPPPPALELNARAVLDPNTFQQKWRQLPISITQYNETDIEISVTPQGVTALTSPQALVQHMQGQSIHCIASGGQAPNLKCFFFAEKAKQSSNYLVECIISSSSFKAQLKIKADDQSTSEAFSAVFQSALSKFGLP